MPEALRLFEIRSDAHVGPDDTTFDLARIEEVFGDVTVLDTERTDRVDPFKLAFHTRFIVATQSDIDGGSAQRVPPCGDQSPAYIGLNGPNNLLDDDEPTPPLM